MLDIDGVIGDFYTGFGGYLNKHIDAGLDLRVEPEHYNVSKWGKGIDPEDIKKEIPRWILDGGYADIPIYDGAKEFVKTLSDKYDVYVVTARIGDFKFPLKDKIKKVIENDTLYWFAKHGLPTHNIYFEHEKSDFCNKYGIKVMVEDKLDNALKAGLYDIDAILMNRAWNVDEEREQPHIRLAFGYQDILDFLEEFV